MPEPRAAFADLEKRIRERPYFEGFLPDLRQNFKPSDTPETGPTTSPDTPQGPGPTSKEIA